MHAYTHVQMHWLENRSMERAPVRARGISGCGHSACVAAEQDLRSLWRLLTKTGSECSFMSFEGGHPSSKPQSSASSLLLHAWENELFPYLSPTGSHNKMGNRVWTTLSSPFKLANVPKNSPLIGIYAQVGCSLSFCFF